jgi:hypothetical protein
VKEVGAAAQRQHGANTDVMLAVGRMYMDVGMFAEAQLALVQAGKADTQNGAAFRFLGEVLLRRGDANRALKLFGRAKQLGVRDAEVDRWEDRAQVYNALQRRVGTEAVAKEVAKNEPLRPSVPPSAPIDLDELAAGAQLEQPPRVAVGGLPSRALPTPRLPRNIPKAAWPPAPKLVSGPDPRLPPPPGAAAGALVREWEDSGRFELQSSELEEIELEPAVSPLPADETIQPRIDSAAPARTQNDSAPLPSFDSSASAWGIEPPTVPGNVAAPKANLVGLQSQLLAAEHDDAAGTPLVSGRKAVGPALVLQHLARVGVFEPEGGAKPAWEQAPKRKTRGAWVLILATLLVAGGGVGGYYYANEVKNERLAQAQALNQEVDALLATGVLDKVRSTDAKLERAFELDSLSQRAARLWLQNRVLHALLAPGESIGIDSATHRAKRVGLDEAHYAFGKVAGFLAEGDVAGAAALLPKWDKKAGKDAYYQLAAGAVLERAGDLRAVERYEAARALDKKLLIADMLLARLALLELGSDKGRQVIDAFKKKGGDAAALAALEALRWAVDPDRPEKLPASAKIDKDVETSLAVPLRPIVYAVEALQAIEAGDYKEASRAITAGVERSLSPAMAARLGFLAIQAGDEKLARKAALRALSFSAVYPRARVLAARVALFGGRLEEAQKAIEQLDPASQDVVIVRAVVAYETVDGSALDAAIDSLGDSKTRPELAALLAMPGVLTGSEYPSEDVLQEMAQPQIPWGQAVAVDIALAKGELELASTLVESWPKDTIRPVYSLRLARLARYRGKLEAALIQSAQALSTPTLPAVSERVLVLLAADKTHEAREVVAKYPALLGAQAAWLNILIDAVQGREKQAQASASTKDFPPEAAPLSVRLLAAKAFAVAGDKRAKDFVKLMQRTAKSHPDAKNLSDLL